MPLYLPYTYSPFLYYTHIICVPLSFSILVVIPSFLYLLLSLFLLSFHLSIILSSFISPVLPSTFLFPSVIFPSFTSFFYLPFLFSRSLFLPCFFLSIVPPLISVFFLSFGLSTSFLSNSYDGSFTSLPFNRISLIRVFSPSYWVVSIRPSVMGHAMRVSCTRKHKSSLSLVHRTGSL